MRASVVDLGMSEVGAPIHHQLELTLLTTWTDMIPNFTSHERILSVGPRNVERRGLEQKQHWRRHDGLLTMGASRLVSDHVLTE